MVPRNPVRAVPRAVRRLYRNAHDPRTTPFLEQKGEIARLAAALTEPLRTMYTVAVRSGLRPSELLALEWSDISHDLRVMRVMRRLRWGKVSTPKSGRGRVVPISPSLATVLVDWRRRTEGTGLVFKPGGAGKFIAMERLREGWRQGLQRAHLAPISFYRATRHTFASHWVMDGHGIEKLSAILGHGDITTTQRYAHLRPDLLSVPDLFSVSGVA